MSSSTSHPAFFVGVQGRACSHTLVQPTFAKHACLLSDRGQNRILRATRLRMSSLVKDAYKVITSPIEGQKTGTSGLRKPTKTVADNPHYVANWIQALFDTLGESQIKAKPIIIIGGDGRYYNKEGIHTIIRMAKANGFQKVLVGRNGILSTPAASALIRSTSGAIGGIILTASHNPGGLDADWGIKYNTFNGGPATELLTDAIYEKTTTLNRYFIDQSMKSIDLSVIGENRISPEFSVHVIDPVENYLKTLEQVFDFKKIKALVSSPDFNLLLDCMNAVNAEYAPKIFVDVLGAKPSSILNAVSLPDFAGKHPDPNLTYAKDLVEALGVSDNFGQSLPSSLPEFGAAFDGDGDRNMILGRGIFVSPSDSVAVIAHYSEMVIPYLSRNKGIKGVARSMPTSGALDRVAKAKGWDCYETPTGWKFFGNLMDADKLSICGEESFGTSSDHIREKDGIWAVLAWLSILAYRTETSPNHKVVSVKQIMKEHWLHYGRNYYGRHDYEGVDAQAASRMMDFLRSQVGQKGSVSNLPPYCVDEFEYTDPIDKSVSKNQGIRVLFDDGSRIVFRTSGTSASGATIRIYLESYSPARGAQESDHDAEGRLCSSAGIELRDLADFAIALSQIQEFTGRNAPTVIT